VPVSGVLGKPVVQYIYKSVILVKFCSYSLEHAKNINRM